MAEVFFSYSHEDENYRDQLEKHLASLRHEGLIESWHDRRILAGSNIDSVIDEKINSADIILLLISSSFISSHYCYSVELHRAMERHTDKSARVIPVILRPCDWQAAPFGKLLAAPKDGKAITTWSNYDEAYTDVAKQIRQAVQQIHSSQTIAPISAQTNNPFSELTHISNGRSSNLRVKKKFSELELDTFCHDGFLYLARFYENSLAELQMRNENISTRFTQVDAETFTAVIYISGEKKSECSVNQSTPFRERGITYSSSASTRGSNSYNEMLTVGNDDQKIFFNAMGISNFKTDNKVLSHEGAAELFWEILMRPIQ